jgi:hypothetical protein
VVRLAGGSEKATTTTKLQLGATISIRLDDPSSLLSAAVPAGKPYPIVTMGAQLPGSWFHPAFRISSDATGYDYSLVVPPSVDLDFSASAQKLTLTNFSTHSVVTASQAVTIHLAPGALLQLHYIASASTTPTQNASTAPNQ